MEGFKRYTTIHRPETAQLFTHIQLNGLSAPDVVWVATEKVHGANFQIATDGENITYGKRKSLLEMTDEFYNFQTLMESYNDKVKALFNGIKESYEPLATKIIVYGELFGGRYNHPEVPKSTIYPKHVQIGVYYTPDVEFYAFDIFVYTEPKPRYLTYTEATQLFENFDFFYNHEIMRGTFEQCMSFDVDTFKTTIPEKLGLPPLEDFENISEGIVVKPVDEVFYWAKGRISLKVKSEMFKEVTGQNKNRTKDKKKKSQFPQDPELTEAWQDLSRYITENRLRNVLSKLGPITEQNQKGQVTKLLANDALEEWNEDNGVELAGLKEDSAKKLTSKLGQECFGLVRSSWASIMKGEF
eukprot:TRINITY_DN11287_c0_g1_i1.p1 TRINITY_DN11287_c0_g1~~TRINITY_DN11287_c0_g1_i1.p1  ORF type:complete len:356 (+),score=69.45 TRINITY_DN11287_c0_g1_i1:13-1080(+)